MSNHFQITGFRHIDNPKVSIAVNGDTIYFPVSKSCHETNQCQDEPRLERRLNNF